MPRFKLTLSLIFIGIVLQAHPWKPAHYVIIDTDCGFDDFRTITLFLASPSVRILGITTSNGVINATDGYYKLQNLLSAYHHEGILTGVNNSSNVEPKDHDSALQFEWGNTVNKNYLLLSATQTVNEILENVKDSVTFICLAGLNTVKTCYDSCSLFQNKVKKIIWVSGFNKTMPQGFNYKLDTNSYAFVKNANIPLAIVNNNLNIDYNDSLINAINKIKNIYSESYLKSVNIANNIFSNKIYDEFAAVFLYEPDLFSVQSFTNITYYTPTKGLEPIRFENAIGNILERNTINSNQVLSVFPKNIADYYSDVQLIMPAAINKYGFDEWTACVLTSELHQHVGMYAIIGAKMGMRAKEYFGAGVDEMNVISYAGTTPPFSCMNDGLQTSTGATLGHGLISIASNSKTLPKAEFNYMNRKITVSLKNEYRNIIESDVKELRMIYGLDSNIYWELVRQKTLKYWSEWDRNDIFSIETEK